MSGPLPKPTAVLDDEEDDEGHMDMQFIQGFADKIQRVPDELQDDPAFARPKINIPKRGEKDFEPLAETVNLQEMMLQNSRQALFDALQGVRGVASKSLSHALLVISRGHVLDTLGITVRRPEPSGGKAVARIELLPEEALYLAERGSLQIWNGRPPTPSEPDLGQWSDTEFGIKGAVEMSVLEVFTAFMGREGLSWQRYQAYAYLKRLGYTVQRTRRFIPAHFVEPDAPSAGGRASWFAWAARLWSGVLALARRTAAAVAGAARLGLGLLGPLRGTMLTSWSGQTYSSMFKHIRFVPSGHSHPLPNPANSEGAAEGAVEPGTADRRDQYAPLLANPYIPFFHVWKPVTAWSKAKWDRGSPAGLANQKPDYAISAVESRNTAMPTLRQLEEIFDGLPDEPTGPPKRVGPQYDHRRPANKAQPDVAVPWYRRFIRAPQEKTYTNPMAQMRNGDRAFIVAVNDSGNTGWVRFGRSGFQDFPMV
ncbi:hypothetical protein CspeluHIS016_0307320 [Cutaneotrichosporon spelunceum]|uniref:tRNA-splicing endonuclease subunit Sen54 N-terminal domain-containing protein n=1 Tax=Cutaneotrichosporon spelunceum TaxID=1672016 RepID=A0AAD3TUR7_9TREE|nr:hypothetical protein CspeluHIS016_0307320 [Cutaneotrichosporon spelunceum]